MAQTTHPHVRLATTAQKLFITMFLNFVITAAELVGGILSGSLALLSDALHNFSDGIAIIVSYVALKLGEQGHTEQYTFGLKRAEILAAILNAVTLILISFFLCKEALERFTHPEPIAVAWMISVASIGLLANLTGTFLLHDVQHNINLKSTYLHLFSDAISSVAVILGGIAIYWWQIYWIDPLLTILMAAYILSGCWEIVKTATNVLMMGAPKSISQQAIKETIERLPGVKNIHHIHLWMLNEQNIYFEAHVETADMLISESAKLSAMIEDQLEKHQVHHVTLQFECIGCAEIQH